MLRITRRSVLGHGVAFGLVLATPSQLALRAEANTHDKGSNPLLVSPILPARTEDGTDIFDLTLGQGETEFFKGVKTRTIGINQSYLGPTIRLTAGNSVLLNVRK